MRVQDKKTRILLASVLKPVDEPRMYERMGQSLAHHGFDVYIAGFPSSSNQPVEGVRFIPHRKFERVSLARIKTRLDILVTALSLRPDLLIVATHELVGMAILFKLITGKKIVYDVQEDYWQNILHTDAWPKLLRPLIAFPLRCKEWITSPFFSKFLLAEQCYLDRLSFVRGKSVVIENKCALYLRRPPRVRKEIIQLIFTGTIAESTGIFEAIRLTKQLHNIDGAIRLTIVGQCFQVKTRQKIEAEISKSPFIRIVGGVDFVSHEKIGEAISSADFGIVSYPPLPHTIDKIPSKLYEYLAGELPILLQENIRWAGLCAPSEAAIVFDFSNPPVNAILDAMRDRRFYVRRAENVTWESEETTLLTTIRSIIP